MKMKPNDYTDFVHHVCAKKISICSIVITTESSLKNYSMDISQQILHKKSTLPLVFCIPKSIHVGDVLVDCIFALHVRDVT